MAGSPKKRAIQERDAIKRIEVTAQLQAKEQTLEFPKARVKYTDGLGAEIVGLISNGIPIEDSVLNGAVVSPGNASRMGIHSSTFYQWQQLYSDFAEGIMHRLDPLPAVTNQRNYGQAGQRIEHACAGAARTVNQRWLQHDRAGMRGQQVVVGGFLGEVKPA